MSEEVDINKLRELLGIKESKQTTAGTGAPGNSTGPGTTNDNPFAERQRQYEEEMKFLSEGGADYGGNEAWKRLRRS